MEIISVSGQAFLLLAGGIVLLGLCLGIAFYSWSLQLFKKLDTQVKQMKQNIESLESLSQFVYETSYRNIQKMAVNDKENGKNLNNFRKEQPILESIKDDIEGLIQKQTEISERLEQKVNEKTSRQEGNFSLDTGSVQFLSEEEKTKYQQISKLVSKHLQDLLKEKRQVTAQELVYSMGDNYSLADIYRTLELMKEKKQIYWSDRNISPQSFLELTK